MKTNNKKIQVSIGIPAYNEEANILDLLKCLKNQIERDAKIGEIVIFTDGGDDNTIGLIKGFKDKRIKLVEGKDRKGQQFRQNQILRMFKGDVVVILEADILPVNNFTINNLVKPYKIYKPNSFDMVIGSPVVVKPVGFFERILAFGYKMKFKIFAEWKGGNNVYTCGGHSMKALSKRFARKLSWPNDVPEDAYTYLYLKNLDYKLYREPSANAYMRNVTTIGDRLKQTRKFISGKKSLYKHFSKKNVDAEYGIPIQLIIKHVAIEFIKHPLMLLLYLLEVVCNRIATIRETKFNALYIPYNSSKKLNFAKK